MLAAPLGLGPRVANLGSRVADLEKLETPERPMGVYRTQLEGYSPLAFAAVRVSTPRGTLRRTDFLLMRGRSASFAAPMDPLDPQVWKQVPHTLIGLGTLAFPLVRP